MGLVTRDPPSLSGLAGGYGCLRGWLPTAQREKALRLNCSGLTLACERHPFLCFPDHPGRQVWKAARGVAA